MHTLLTDVCENVKTKQYHSPNSSSAAPNSTRIFNALATNQIFPSFPTPQKTEGKPCVMTIGVEIK